jgi:hypothetical protein
LPDESVCEKENICTFIKIKAVLVMGNGKIINQSFALKQEKDEISCILENLKISLP